ncbi:AAA family ATPase [Amycolatopsis australiensis]|uniref:Predicted ABC-type ATPase n=1 Tax=Amycolatopsis australiensis TaxID=546364 RepID=A0A1K1PVI6_9PSEU|nr:AAA family ATPase [Amycolatopsis australiensis]SFW51489.1 Predicted ABC-type ATPase [Amycolatopsis australiensis]
MPRLIHLNGPSGIGKSTIALSYAERHPGVLDLDTDRVVCLIGGWRDTFFQTFRAAQLLALAMAETHLRTGHDVVMPQLATRVADVEPFETAARQCGAEYREILLTAPKPVACARFAGRAAGGDATTRGVDDVVNELGGAAVVERIHDQLAAYLPLRPGCLVVPTGGRTPEQTYADVVALVDGVSAR